MWLCWVLFVGCGIFSCSMQTLNCGMWDLSSLTRDRTRAPALGAQNLSHWTTREVSPLPYYLVT